MTTLTTDGCVHRYIKSGKLLKEPNTYEAICADCDKILDGGWTPPSLGSKEEIIANLLVDKLVEKGIRYGKY